MNPRPASKVIVIGGGITGLVSARRIRLGSPDTEVLLLEAGERLGGKVHTHEVAGVPVEAGADWFLTRQPAALELCRELGLEDRLVPPARAGAYVWSAGKLRKLIPDLVRGVPTRPMKAARAGLLSPTGALRAWGDLVSRRSLAGADISVGSLVRARFGDEVMKRLVDPMLAASRSGSADEMSLAAAAPELDRAARSHRSVIRGLRATGEPTPSGPPFLGLRGGMTQLVDALVDDLRGVEVRMRAPVTALERKGDRYVVNARGDAVEADAVVVAVPSFAAAQLLEGLDKELAGELERIHYAPALVLTLVYPAGAGTPPPHGSGMLVPSSEGRLLTACAWFSEKWEHARPPDGSLVLRCFVGRSSAAAMSDKDLVSAVAGEIHDALGLAGAPSNFHVTRWDAALPVYRVGHLDLMDTIERRLSRHSGLALAGAGYRGSGLPDCISQASRAAAAVSEFLGPKGR